MKEMYVSNPKRVVLAYSGGLDTSVCIDRSWRRPMNVGAAREQRLGAQ
jgi:argininosuccinate synthase